MINSALSCPLCLITDINTYYTDKLRDYFCCKRCHLIFVPPSQYLNLQEEKERYDLHQNSPDDQNYRQFLNRLFFPIQKYLSPKSHGLDFGSGPGPTLSIMLKEIGHSVDIYDYFYADDDTVFKKQYDFITSTEVMEHLHRPKKELDRLWDCLKPDGQFGLMTKLVIDREKFKNWHYKNDPTHVCFFSKTTFEWLAKQWNAKIEFIDNDVIIFLKNEPLHLHSEKGSFREQGSLRDFCE